MENTKHPFIGPVPSINLTSGVEEEIASDGTRQLTLDGRLVMRMDPDGFISIRHVEPNRNVAFVRTPEGGWNGYAESSGHIGDADMQCVAQAIVLATHLSLTRIQ